MTAIIQWDPNNDSAVSKFREEGVDIPCLVPWRFMFIQEHTKKVFGCCFHKRPYGDLVTHSLEEIWNGPDAQEMRGSLLAKRPPRYCLNHSAACPIIRDLRLQGQPREVQSDIVMGRNDYWALDEGWHAYEAIPDGVRWTKARAKVRIRASGFRAVRIEAVSLAPDLGDQPVRGTVALDGVPLGAFMFDAPRWQTLIYPLPAAARKGRSEPDQAALLEISVDRLFRPSRAADGNDDTRDLGIAVRRIRMFGDVGAFEKPVPPKPAAEPDPVETAPDPIEA